MTDQPHVEHLTLATTITPGDDQGTGSRTITGMLAPYQVTAARTSAGVPIQFQPDALVFPTDLSRVKLCIEHDRTNVVGILTATDSRPDGAWGTFSVPAGPEGDDALTRAQDHRRDGLSVGVDVRRGKYTADGETYVITEAVVEEVSLCAFPAFADARVNQVRMSQPERTTMDPVDLNEPTIELEVPTQIAAAAATPAPQAPAFLHRPTKPATFADVCGHIARMANDGLTATQITASLADVVPADDAGHGLLAPSYIGELWQATTTGRPYVDGSTIKPLGSGFKTYAWAWQTRAQVNTYAGDKAEIPTNEVATKPFEVTPERLAGGWDIDRIYIDLGDASIVEAMFTAAVEDYAAKTNAAHRAAILAKATAITGTTDLPSTLVRLGVEATKVGARVDTIAVATDLWTAFANLTRDQVPFWLGGSDTLGIATLHGTAGNLNFFADPTLTAGTVLAFDRRAVTFFEKTPPVRAQAVDLAHGGIDLGVFGYHASLVSEPRAVWKATITAGGAA